MCFVWRLKICACTVWRLKICACTVPAELGWSTFHHLHLLKSALPDCTHACCAGCLCYCAGVCLACPAGRLASSNPNMQAVPAHDERGRMFRAAFTADEGHTLVAADYSQVGPSCGGLVLASLAACHTIESLTAVTVLSVA